ncbi:MAG: Gfo/Idh/MocA family protein [Terriglobia bacterium]
MSNESDVSRRDFLKSAVEATVGVAAFSGVSFVTQPERVFGANDRVRVAICGLHGRGEDHIKAYSQLKNVEIAALCDVDENVLRKRLAEFEVKPKTYIDVRKLLEDKSIDAISIATPNHWHSLMGIWACQAGKDVYVEKPCCHNLWEGRQLLRAAEKYHRMVQHGTQIRSSPVIKEAIQKIHDGYVGDLYLARGLCFKWRDTIGHAPVEPVPPGVHYDLWTGPARLLPFTRNHFHYNWHWFWNYGNGDLGNQGVHQVDMARWGLGLKFPNRVAAIGGHFMFDDDQQTPNTLNCTFEFDLPNGKRRMMEFEVRHWITNNEAGIGTDGLVAPEDRSDLHHNTIGNLFYGSKGYLATGDEDACAYKSWLGPSQTPADQAHGCGDHFGNFIDCVRSRKREDLNAWIEEGYISCSLIHLANASYRLGRALRFDPETQQVIGDDEANNLLRDGDRGYRSPFVIPEQV